MTQLNHPAISLYDNAMLIIAMESFAALATVAGEEATADKWKAAASTQVCLSVLSLCLCVSVSLCLCVFF